MARTLLAVNLTFSADDLAAGVDPRDDRSRSDAVAAGGDPGAHPEITRFSNSLHADVRDIAQAPSIEVLADAGDIERADHRARPAHAGAHAVRLSQLDAYRQNYDRITLSGLAMLVVGLILLAR